jgi:hypothetical protein
MLTNVLCVHLQRNSVRYATVGLHLVAVGVDGSGSFVYLCFAVHRNSFSKIVSEFAFELRNRIFLYSMLQREQGEEKIPVKDSELCHWVNSCCDTRIVLEIYHSSLSIHRKNSRAIRSRFCLHIKRQEICWGQTADPLKRWNRRRFSTSPIKMVV